MKKQSARVGEHVEFVYDKMLEERGMKRPFGYPGRKLVTKGIIKRYHEKHGIDTKAEAKKALDNIIQRGK